MATTVEPFSFVTAEVSEEYIGVFPQPDTVPKYLETLGGKTGVQIINEVPTLVIKGSWLSLKNTHFFLSEFLSTYKRSEQNDGLVNSWDKVADSVEKPRRPRKRRHKFSVSDDENDRYDRAEDNAFFPAYSESSTVDSASSWLKFTAEVLPQIEPKRSKRASIYTDPKDKQQKVPEPFVLVANFRPPTAPTARKVPNLDDIERVLKRVYEKDVTSLTAKPLQEDCEMLPNVDEHNGSKSEPDTTQQQISEMTQQSNNNLVEIDQETQPTAQASTQYGNHHGASFISLHPQFYFAEDNVFTSIVEDQHSSQLSDLMSLGHDEEDFDQSRSEKHVQEKSVAVSNEQSHSAAHTSDGDLVISELPLEKHQKTIVTSLRVSRRKGHPKKKEKRAVGRLIKVPVENAPSARTERVAKRNKKPLECEAHLKVKRKARQCAQSDHNSKSTKRHYKADHASKKQHRGRPAKPKTDPEDEKDYNCNECPYVTKKHSHLREHKRRVHITKEFTCDKCGKVFGFGKDLKRHRKTHQRAENCCDICGKMYKCIRSLADHKKTHADDYIKPSFPCEFCDKIFSTKYVLAYHIKSEHLGMKKTYICPTCGKSFSQKNSYLQHANVHIGIRPHQCDICGKSFSYEKSLKEHKYMHGEDKQFECPVCHKKFRQTSGVSIHMKIHKEHKDYVCSACGKGFSQKQALVRHERIHKGEKPFSCGLCQRTFTDSSILRRHMILIHKKDPKQWREDTISKVKKRTDFFISVVGESPEVTEDGRQKQTDKHDMLLEMSADRVELPDKSEDDSFSFVPVGTGSPGLQVLTAAAQIQTAGMTVVSGDGSSLTAVGPLPMNTVSQSQSHTLSQRAESEEATTSLPISFSSLSLPSTRQQRLPKATQPIDMSSQSQSQSSTQDDSEVQSPSIIPHFPFVDSHRLSASDFYPNDSMHLQYSFLNQAGTFHPPLVLLPNSLSFQSDPVGIGSADESLDQSDGFENLAVHPQM